MNHLPYPQDSPVPPVSVPYYDKFKFDGGGFTEFPTRCGFDKSNFVWGNFESIPWDDHTALLQSWLFFGLIHECLDAPEEDFIDRKRNRSRPKSCRNGACTLLTTLDRTKPGTEKRNNLSKEVAFSIAVLGITLDQILTDFDLLTQLGGAEEELRQLSHAATSWPTTEFARKRLEAVGWCKSESLRLGRYIKATGMYYCGSMQRVGPPVGHSRCGETGCEAENVVEETYVTAHADECSLGSGEMANYCTHEGPVVPEVAKILDADRLPLLELRRDSPGTDVQIRAVPFGKSTSYTALSHVWADGMGNPHANTLPQCQINRLHALLAALDGEQSHSLKSRLLGGRQKADTVYIWIDTLLIPLEKRLRKKAISRMYDIFKNDKSVLVLDRSLIYVSADRPAEELCFRLSAASWMRRAWTLQEGALANNLYVQFKERAVCPVKLAGKAYQRVWKAEPWNVILEECGTVINYITQSGDAGGDAGGDDQLHNVLLGLGQRSTSHPEDKEICFVLMLRMDMKSILAAEGHQRTLQIVQQMPYIPRSFLWHTQPRLDIPGFRWLRKHIIASGGGVPELGFTLTEQGLLHIRDVASGKWYVLRWQGDMEPIAENLTSSERTWTVLAALPNRETMFSAYHTILIRLHWTLESGSSEELLRHASSKGDVRGEFVGRAFLEELDEVTSERLKARTGVKRDTMAEFREAVRRGDSSLDGVSEAMRRVYEEEGDDSWYILDGTMESSSRRWLVA